MAQRKGSIPWNKNISIIRKKCKYCNNYFEGPKWYIKDKIYCNNLCKSKAFKNKPNKGCFKKGKKPWNYIDGRSNLVGPGRYGPEWTKIRFAVFIRDNFTCQHCFRTNMRLDAHHKIPFLLTKDNSLSNLLTLCRRCHRKEESRIMKELKKQEEY